MKNCAGTKLRGHTPVDLVSQTSSVDWPGCVAALVVGVSVGAGHDFAHHDVVDVRHVGHAGDGAGVDGVQVGQGVDRPSVNTKTDE